MTLIIWTRNSKIKTINPDDPKTWNGKFFVDIDIDWAAEAVIEDTIRLLEEYQVPATFYATHKSVALSNIQNSSQFENGLLLNCVPLLRGDGRTRRMKIMRAKT